MVKSLAECIEITQNRKLFPSQHELSTDISAGVLHIEGPRITSTLFKIYAHVYRHHIEFLEENDMVKHCNSLFKHLLYFANQFDLMPGVDVTKPLQNLITLFLSSPSGRNADIPGIVLSRKCRAADNYKASNAVATCHREKEADKDAIYGKRTAHHGDVAFLLRHPASGEPAAQTPATCHATEAASLYIAQDPVHPPRAGGMSTVEALREGSTPKPENTQGDVSAESVDAAVKLSLWRETASMPAAGARRQNIAMNSTLRVLLGEARPDGFGLSQVDSKAGTTTTMSTSLSEVISEERARTPETKPNPLNDTFRVLTEGVRGTDEKMNDTFSVLNRCAWPLLKPGDAHPG
eukprot:GHVT01069668.1.p1 GENE.GHVT01069668.1~~GHVT01069668.1.p1  ORF type:complete len:350 (-),score=27.10 GHVT01069668.1:251-1300(-)